MEGYYALSKKWFNYFIAHSKDSEYISKAKSYVDSIENHYKNGTFIQMDYAKYTSLGNSLQTGDIVYLNSKSKKAFSSRPLVVWKITDKEIYGFQITTADRYKRAYNHVLRQEDYPNFNEDRYVKEYFSNFQEKEIEKIIGRVTEFDYWQIIEKNYRSCCYLKSRKNCEMFFDEAFEFLNIKINDFICTYKDQGLEIFFVIDIKDGKYICVKVIEEDKRLYLESNNKYILTKEDYIMRYKSTDNSMETKKSRHNLIRQLRI